MSIRLTFLAVSILNIVQNVFGGCVEIPVMEGFDKERFMSGGWYEIGRYMEPYEANAYCLYSEYKTPTSDDSSQDFYILSKQGITPQHVKRESVFINDLGELDCAVDYLSPKFDSWNPIQLYTAYWQPKDFYGMSVVATNYEDFAILQECGADDVERVQVLARRPAVDDVVLDFAEKVLLNFDSDFSKFVRTDEYGSCPYRNQKQEALKPFEQLM